MRILYVDAVGPFGGASRSLYEVLRALPPGAVQAYFVMQRGTAESFYSKLAQDIITARGMTRFDNTRASAYKGVRWLVLLREVFYLPFMLIALFRARLRWKHVDLIHVNEIVDIIPGLCARLLFRAPMIVHTRCLCRTDLKSFRTRWLHRRLKRSAGAVIAIDENVRATLPSDVVVEIIHNSFDAGADGKVPANYIAQLERLRPSALKVGFIGNLHRSKGLIELLDAASLLKAAGQDVQFIVVGGGTASDQGLIAGLLNLFGLAQNVRAHLMEEVERRSLSDDFVLLGATSEIQEVYKRIDLLAFPSHLDAPGRPVFEAAFFSVPSIVAVKNPHADTVVNGETAIAISNPEPQLISEAIMHFVRNRDELKRMGRNARELAMKNFRPETNSKKLLDFYRKILQREKGAAR